MTKYIIPTILKHSVKMSNYISVFLMNCIIILLNETLRWCKCVYHRGRPNEHAVKLHQRIWKLPKLLRLKVVLCWPLLLRRAPWNHESIPLSPVWPYNPSAPSVFIDLAVHLYPAMLTGVIFWAQLLLCFSCMAHLSQQPPSACDGWERTKHSVLNPPSS